jgi:hypothetical protein
MNDDFSRNAKNIHFSEGARTTARHTEKALVDISAYSHGLKLNGNAKTPSRVSAAGLVVVDTRKRTEHVLA